MCQSNGLSSVQTSNLANDVSTHKVPNTAVSSESKGAQDNVSDEDDAFENGASWWNDMVKCSMSSREKDVEVFWWLFLNS